jgi:hypothetical protein
LILDEPALAAGTDPEARSALERVMGATPVAAGLHVCGDVDPALAASFSPAWLTIDTGAAGPMFADAAPALARAVAAGTRIIWCAVPAAPPPLPSVGTLVARVRHAEGLLVMAGAGLRSLEDGLIAPGCGLEAISEEQAAAVVSRAREVAEALDA